MKTLCVIFLTVCAVATFFGCSAPAANTNANTASTSDGQPTIEALKALETKAWDAYKNKGARFFETFLTDKFFASSQGRRLDKSATIKIIAELKCDIKSISFADEKLTNVGAATAVMTTKVTQDGTCEGQEKIAPFISATLYVRKATEWKAAWHGEVPIVDPNAPTPAKTAGNDATKEPIRSMPDSETRELAAIERSVWEAWMNRDGAKLDGLTARELAFVNIFGGYYTNREDTLKNWRENPCEIKSIDVTDAGSVSVSNDTSVLVHHGIANGTCFGQPVGPVLGTSIYAKDGPTWKLAFTMNMPGP